MNLTAHEINEKYKVENRAAKVEIDGIMQDTIVYTLDDVNKIINNVINEVTP